MMTEERQEKDIRAQLCALSAALSEEGISGLSYSLRHTLSRKTGVRHGALSQREDADDTVLVIRGAYAGRKCMSAFCGVPDAETAAVFLKESAAVLLAAEAGTAEAEEADKTAQTAGAAFSFEPHEAAETALAEAEQAASGNPALFLAETLCYEQTLTETRCYGADGTLRLCDETGYHCLRVMVIAKRDGQTEYTGGCRYGSTLSEINPQELLTSLTAQAAGGLSGSSIPSGSYRTLLSPAVLAELAEAFLPAFYAENQADGQSALFGVQGKQVAASFLTLREDPQAAGGRVRRRVDDEGTPTSETWLIRDGVFETAPAKRADDAESTGNGFLQDPQSDVGTGVTNVLLTADRAHTRTQEELFALLGNGIYVTAIDGTFAGTNAKTGSFSLIAKGRLCENGAVTGAFREVTIAGNFFEMLKAAEAAGDTLSATWPDLSCVLAPALLCGELVVSGL